MLTLLVLVLVVCACGAIVPDTCGELSVQSCNYQITKEGNCT